MLNTFGVGHLLIFRSLCSWSNALFSVSHCNSFDSRPDEHDKKRTKLQRFNGSAFESFELTGPLEPRQD